MAVVSNIHIGLAAWTGSGTSYTAGQRRSNGSNAYQCVTSGTGAASGGPTGTGLLIQDNTAWWTYLSSIDYTALGPFITALPTTTFSQSYTAQIWNDGVDQPVLGASADYIDISNGQAPTATYPLLITAAPGESFCDTLHNNPQGATALSYNTSNGIAVSMASMTGPAILFYVAVPYTTISRLQLIDTNSTINNTVVVAGTGATNFALDSCILDSYAQSDGQAFYNAGPTGVRVRNCLFVDRQSSGGTYSHVYLDVGSTTTLCNCTFVNVNNATGAYSIATVGTVVGMTVVSNCGFFGTLGVGSPNTVGATTVDHSVFSASALDGNSTNGTGNLFSKTASNNFVAATTDFRLKNKSADCYNAGTVQSTYVPSLKDIAGTPRPQAGSWDVGCWEFLVPLVYRRNLTRLRMKHLRNADPRDLARRDWDRLADHFRDGQIAGRPWI